MPLIITSTLPVTVSMGVPATLSSPPVWTIITGQALLVVAKDGLSAVITPAVGLSKISVISSADLGDGKGPVPTKDVILVNSTPQPAPVASLNFTVQTNAVNPIQV